MSIADAGQAGAVEDSPFLRLVAGLSYLPGECPRYVDTCLTPIRRSGKTSLREQSWNWFVGIEKEFAMPVRKLKDFLDKEKVKYLVINHSPAYTAQEIAASAHIPGKELAKTVMVKIDGKMAMAVLPASYRVDLAHLRDAVGAKNVTLAGEQEFKDTFPECEVGAMPPFGNLYGMEVYAAASLAEDDAIAFNAGSHKELIRLAYKDFEKLVKPKVVEFSLKG
jgi:Ala-tRNA(Pro) deacylase